jgi:hypothetical protein
MTKDERTKSLEKVCREILDEGRLLSEKYPASAKIYLAEMTGKMLGVQKAMYALVDPKLHRALTPVFRRVFDEGQSLRRKLLGLDRG